MPGSGAFALSLVASSVRTASEGSYLHHVADGERFAVLLLGEAAERPGAGVILLDDHLPDRFEALARFHRAMRGRSYPQDRRLTRLRRRNLRQMLQAVDGRLAGATYPQIAEALFGTGRIRAVSWKSLSLRDTTMRRVGDGFRLVNGGYRRLLRHRRPT